MNDTAHLESDILATILSQGRRALGEVPDLSRSDFASTPHRDVFVACLKLDQDDSPVNLTTVYSMLPEKSPARALVGDLPPPGALSILAALARGLRQARALDRAETIAGRVLAAAKTAGTAAARLEEISALGAELIGLESEGSDDRSYVSLAEVAAEESGRLEMSAFDEPEKSLVETGIPGIDDVLHVEAGDFVVVGGVTASGKSSLCGQIAVTMANRAMPVIFITSEMTHRQMLARFASATTGHPVMSFLRSRAAMEIGSPAIYRTLGALPIYFQRRFPPRMRDASAAIRMVVAKHGAKLAIIDYAQRLSDPTNEFQEQAIAQIAEESKNLAMELGIVVIAAAQLNRQPSGRKEPRPMLADLRGSGKLEQEANHVIFVHRPDQFGLQGSPEIIIAKQRNGPQATVPVVFEAESCVFRPARPIAA